MIQQSGYFRKQVDTNGVPRFDKNLEEVSRYSDSWQRLQLSFVFWFQFFSICDQFELHLITAKKCIQQNNFAQAHLPVPVTPVRQPNEAMKTSLTYLQFLELVKNQVRL